MKRPLHTLFSILILLCLVNSSPLFAKNIWESNLDGGEGEWKDNTTWKNMITGVSGVPEPGDLIIINGADIVTISSTVDLRTVHNGEPTNIIINGILKFWSDPGCINASCDVNLFLDSGSEIDVQSAAPAKGIQEGGPEPDKKDIYIGTQSVLPTVEWPFGPGILPMQFLPVELVAFRGIALENSVLLSWQTGSEESTKKFVLERSAMGQGNFVEIGDVSAKGYSESIQNYTFEDKAPLMMGYYRLKIFDFDGSFEFSQIIAIEKPHTGVTEFEVFPVPIQNEVNIQIHSNGKSNSILKVTNCLGQVIITEQLKLNEGVNKFTFDWNSLNSGIHFIIIENEQEKLVRKVF